MNRFVAIGSLVTLSAIGAELLAAYNDTTGRPLALLGNLVFFALLYGCPALLIRELARRTGRGWPALLLLSAAAGLLQAGVIDQSLFAERYDDVRGWEETVRATYVAPLGVSAYMLQSFVLGHVVFSFSAPIALAEAVRPQLAHRSWLGRRGMIVAAALWLLVAGMILVDSGDAERARAAELLTALAVVAALIAAALRVDVPLRRAPAARVGRVLVISFLLAAAHSAAPETWAGVGVAVAVAAVAAALLAQRDWGLMRVAAIATGVLLARGVLAFTYYPVVGETSAAQKYGHNVVMLAIVAGAGVYAIRRAAGKRAPSSGTDAAM